MSYFVSPVLGMSLPNAGTNQTFEIAVQNANMALIEGGFTSDRTTLGTHTTQIATLNANSGRGTLADYKVATPAALQALTGMQAGDTAVMAGDGTNFSQAVFQYNGSKWGSPVVQFLLNTTAAFAAFTTYLALGTNTNIIQTGGVGVVTTTAQLAVYNPTSTLWNTISAPALTAPTITPTGGTASQSPGGEVTFAGCTTLQLTNIFPINALAPDKWRMLLDVVSMASAGTVTFQLTLAGVPVTTGSYDAVLLSGSAAAAGVATPLATTNVQLSNGSAVSHFVDASFIRPNGASETVGLITGLDYQNPMVSGSAVITTRGWAQRNLTAYDGILLTFSAAATGTLNLSPLVP